ncbi:MAG: 5-(carboxyamino)imidazole ribonucleotide mutase [Candidatus Marinimicrobia bacterium]|nr:5-(carboxyamino)imidazole ribonucleotide mutase [Candidatus Neomarinimicrobiota bacterium]|tara:strand:- start:24259 stop:24720 length:462 start_codon:yes stop_codon:yes gene_type:complete
MKNKVAILLGSKTDKPLIEPSMPYYDFFGIDVEVHVMSAHRNPKEVAKFASEARDNGYNILVGSAGMSAHLAGALKAHSTLPVVGIPLPGGMMDGLDSLLSTVNMPKGVPVATVSMGKAGAINAAVLCAEIFSLNNSELVSKLSDFKKNGCML